MQCLWLEVFVEKRVFSHLKNHLNSCHGNQSVSCDQALNKLPEKLSSRLLVQEEQGFQKGAQCAPLAAGAQKNPGVDRVNLSINYTHSLSPIELAIVGHVDCIRSS